MTNYEKPVIIWLDSNISRLGHCQMIKKAFAGILVPDWSYMTFPDTIHIDNLIKDIFSKNSCSYENNAVELYTFIDEQDCVQSIEKNKNKRIFLIVSNLVSEHFVQQIVQICPEALKNSADDHCWSVYVSWYNSPFINQHWITAYFENASIFTGEMMLLDALINNIGDYFINLAQKQNDCRTSTSIHQSLEYFSWARTLFMRANLVLEITMYKRRERNVLDQIAKCEALLKDLSGDVDIDQYILCSDTVDKSNTEIPEFSEQVHLNALSFPAITESTNVDSIHLSSESAGNISPVHIQEQLLSQTKEFVENPQNSSQIRVYLQLPSTETKKFKTLHSILTSLFSTNLVFSSEGQEDYRLLEENGLLFIVQNLSTDDDKMALQKVCSLGASIPLYLLGVEPDTPNAREEFFMKYPQVCAILDDPEALAVKIALDVALKSRTMGDRYTRNKDKDRANKMYDQCIGLLNQLNVLAVKNMSDRD